MISDFRRGAHEIWDLLGFYAA